MFQDNTKYDGEHNMNEETKTIRIPNEFFCKGCKLRHKIVEKAIREMIE